MTQRRSGGFAVGQFELHGPHDGCFMRSLVSGSARAAARSAIAIASAVAAAKDESARA